MSNRILTSILKISLLSSMLVFTSSAFADPVRAALSILAQRETMDGLMHMIKVQIMFKNN